MLHFFHFTSLLLSPWFFPPFVSFNCPSPLIPIRYRVSRNISIGYNLLTPFFSPFYNQLYVKIMHICKSVLKYYNLIFYSRFSSASSNSLYRKQVPFSPRSAHCDQSLKIHIFYCLFFFVFTSTMRDNVLWGKEGKGNGWRGWDEEIFNIFLFWEKVTINFPFRVVGQIRIEGASVSVGPNHKKASKNLYIDIHECVNVHINI